MELQLLWILLESCSCLSTRCKQNCLPSEFGSSINYRSWSDCVYPIPVLTLPGTNSSHLKMDGWKTSFLLGWPPGRCYVGSMECSQMISWSVVK